MNPLSPGVGSVARTSRRWSDDEHLGRVTALMAAGTLVSRLTGLARIVAASYALGYGALADGFNLANNTPNIVHDLVLGGVLAATFVPLFVDRLATRPREEALESIGAVVTLSAVVLVVATVLFVLAAPLIIALYTVGAHGSGVAAERSTATELLRYFAPQLAAYGAISLMTAILNTARRFAAPAFVPIVNNLVAIAVLLEFAAASHGTSLASTSGHHGLVLLLGLGTTLGVVVQGALLVPSVRACGIPVRWRWRPSDPAVKEIARLSSWTLGFVATNQIAVFTVSALAIHLGHGPFTAYTYAFIFFQLPFGMVAISVMSTATPALSARYSAGDAPGFARQFALGLRRLLAGIVPAAVGYLVLARPLMSLLLGVGAGNANGASGPHLTSSLLILFALGLPGYCTYLYAVRAFQTRRDTRTPFYCYLLENSLNIVLAFALSPLLGARGLALSLSCAYSVAAVVALVALRLRTGPLGGVAVARSFSRTLLLSAVMAVVVAIVTTAIGSDSGIGLYARVVAGAIAGLVTYGAGAALAGTLAGWQTSRNAHPRAARGVNGRHPSRHR